MDLSDGGSGTLSAIFQCNWHHAVWSEIASGDDESPNQRDSEEDQRQGMGQQRTTGPQRAAQLGTRDDDYDRSDDVPGQYNPNDYKNLQVTQEIEELFTYITRFVTTPPSCNIHYIL